MEEVKEPNKKDRGRRQGALVSLHPPLRLRRWRRRRRQNQRQMWRKRRIPRGWHHHSGGMPGQRTTPPRLHPVLPRTQQRQGIHFYNALQRNTNIVQQGFGCLECTSTKCCIADRRLGSGIQIERGELMYNAGKVKTKTKTWAMMTAEETMMAGKYQACRVCRVCQVRKINAKDLHVSGSTRV